MRRRGVAADAVTWGNCNSHELTISLSGQWLPYVSGVCNNAITLHTLSAARKGDMWTVLIVSAPPPCSAMLSAAAARVLRAASSSAQRTSASSFSASNDSTSNCAAGLLTSPNNWRTPRSRARVSTPASSGCSLRPDTLRVHTPRQSGTQVRALVRGRHT
jgi:hypothetical protein